MRNAVDNLPDDVLADIFRYLLAQSLFVVSVSVTPKSASSSTPITVSSFHRLLSASFMAVAGRAIATSPASLVNDPPCPSPSKSPSLRLLQRSHPLLVC